VLNSWTEAQGDVHLLNAMPSHKGQTVEQFTASLLQSCGAKGHPATNVLAHEHQRQQHVENWL
jgi:hypothetical protein